MKIHNSFLFIPADQDKFYKKIPSIMTNAFILDLEDALPEKNYDKVFSVISENASVFTGKYIFVRINNTCNDAIRRDFELLKKISQGIGLIVQGIFIPKFESYNPLFDDFLELNKSLKQYIIVETAKGIDQLKNVMQYNHEKIFAITLGAEDLMEDFDYERTEENLLFFRRQISFVAKLYRKYCYDTVYPFIKDDVGFLKEVDLLKTLGFDGKLLIHPRQAELFKQNFFLSTQEIEEYRLIIQKFDELTKMGKGVLVYKDKIYEKPHIKSIKKKLRWYDE